MLAAGTGVMAEAFRAEGIHRAFYIVPAVSLALAGVLFAASRTVGTADMDKLQRWMRAAADMPAAPLAPEVGVTSR